MTEMELPSDPLWPRAAHWFVPASGGATAPCDLALLGVPAWRTSITPTGAHATPAAVRDALLRYSTFSASHGVDVAEPDGGRLRRRRGARRRRRRGARGRGGRARGGGRQAARRPGRRQLAHVLGDAGVVAGEGELASVGLITVDAHHDLRDGISNGSPVRRLIEAGLPGANVVQIGIADFSNSAAYAARARELGIHVITRGELRRAPLADIASHALAIAGAGGRPVFVDIDVDVCDRAAVPGCPSAAPGGISADELRQLAFLLARSPMVRGIDIAEIDADDRRTGPAHRAPGRAARAGGCGRPQRPREVAQRSACATRRSTYAAAAARSTRRREQNAPRPARRAPRPPRLRRQPRGRSRRASRSSRAARPRRRTPPRPTCPRPSREACGARSPCRTSGASRPP